MTIDEIDEKLAQAQKEVEYLKALIRDLVNQIKCMEQTLKAIQKL